MVSQTLSISNSLHLSIAAEPEPHPPARQSQLRTFNPSFPRLLKQLCSLPLSPSPFQNRSLPRSPFNYGSEAGPRAPAPQNARVCRRDALGIRSRCAHAGGGGRAESAALQLVRGRIHGLCAAFFSSNLITRPHPHSHSHPHPAVNLAVNRTSPVAEGQTFTVSPDIKSQRYRCTVATPISPPTFTTCFCHNPIRP